MYRITDKYIRQAVESILGVKNDVHKNRGIYADTNDKNENYNNPDSVFFGIINRHLCNNTMSRTKTNRG